MSVQTYFDRIATDFDSYYERPQSAFQAWTNSWFRKTLITRRLAIGLEVLNRHPQQSILDIGCGSGVLAIPLARDGHRVVGIDFAPAMITIARERAAAAGVAVDFRVADFLEASFPTFDSCVAFGVLEYFQDPRSILAKMLAVVRSGGTVVFDLPSLANYHTPLRIPYLLGRRAWAYFHTDGSMRRLLASATDRIAASEVHPYGAGNVMVITRR